MSEVLNLHKLTKPKTRMIVSIMRGTPWGNPFIMGKDGTRERVVQLFRMYAKWRLQVQPSWLNKLKGRDLLCCCAPEVCHGDVLLDLLKQQEKKDASNSKDDSKKGIT